MSAYHEFHKLALAADSIRPRDRAEFYARLDAAAAAAMDEVLARGDWNKAADVYLDWIRVPRPRGASRLSELPPRVAAALGEATYRRLQEESSQ